MLLAFFAGASPAAVRAQEAPADESARSLLQMAWGSPEPATVYLGMWSKHFHPGVTNNQMIGASLHGYFAGTFLNSWHERSYAVGVERSVGRGELGRRGAYSLGYRLGAINGYDNRLIKGAGSTPVVPFLQIVGNASWKKVGVQASYCWLVFTGGFFVRL